MIIVEDAQQAGIIAAALIATRAVGAPCTVALPGGRSVVSTYEQLAPYPASVLERLHVRIGDERIRGEKNEDVIREHLIGPAAEREITIPFETPLREGTNDEIVLSYRKSIGEDPFDIVLLGVGEDGHVLGLYPGFPQLDSEERVEAFDDSPKPPPERMTTTLRCYDPERTLAILLVIGDAKRDALRTLMDDPDHHDCPAAYFARFANAYVITDQQL